MRRFLKAQLHTSTAPFLTPMKYQSNPQPKLMSANENRLISKGVTTKVWKAVEYIIKNVVWARCCSNDFKWLILLENESCTVLLLSGFLFGTVRYIATSTACVMFYQIHERTIRLQKYLVITLVTIEAWKEKEIIWWTL